MKTNLFTLILCLCTCSMLAQSTWSIGAETSILSSGIENQNPYNLEKLPAINTYGNAYSLNLERFLKNGFSLSLEPTFLELGQDYNDVLIEEDYIRNISLDYLQLPLMLSKYFGEEKIKIHLKGGAYASYLIRSSFEESTLLTEGGKVGPSTIVKNSDRFNTVDIGLKLNLGSRISLSEKLMLHANYGIGAGFRDLNSEPYRYEPGYKLEYKKSRNVYHGINFGLFYAL